MNVRPSSLPKLALCGQFEGATGTSPAAARGTMLDRVFRHVWEGGDWPTDLLPEDREAVEWAVAELTNFPEFDKATTDESDCRIAIPSFDRGGTADAVCVDGAWIADLKSGQIYDYRAQMAAYCLGLMHTHLAPEWTAHLLFCDQRRVVTHHFTYTEARDIVNAVLANVGTPPKLNDYCGWCKHASTCPPRVAAAESALATTVWSMLAILEDPAKLGDFLDRCRVFDDFREQAEKHARRLMEQGTDVQGWKLGKARRTETVEAAELVNWLDRLKPADVVLAHGALSAKKARSLFESAGVEMPAEIITTKESARPLTKL